MEVKEGITVWANGLNYEVEGKLILDNVSFVALPGQFTAIMGPSGSGKTTLLNAMLNRLKGLKGKVHFNGVRVDSQDALKHAHYVMAHDVALHYLTVRETLLFGARLRLSDLTYEEQVARVNEVMEWLALEDCADTYVGGEWRRGISKGQLKRLAIAVELLGDPDVLVLDEPTSGLDSHLALDLCIRLRSIAHQTNTTIIASIHQPSQRAFDCFDRLALISNGGVLYCGPLDTTVDYFESLYRHQPEGYSLPDYLLEIATIQEFTGAHPQKSKEGNSTTQGNSVVRISDESSTNSGPILHYSTTAKVELMQQAFLSSEHYKYIQNTIDDQRQKPLPEYTVPLGGACCTGWWKEFGIIWQRSSLNSLRNPFSTVIILLITIVQALVLGGLFFQLQTDVVDVNTPHTPMSEWSLWSNPIVEFLAYGMDHEGYDPFLNILEIGVDGNDRSTLFDFMTNQDVIDWLPQVSECIRDRFQHNHILPSGWIYPDWKWEVGSIDSQTNTLVDGDGSIMVTMPLETGVSMIVQLMQLFDFMITGKFQPPQFPNYYGIDSNLMYFWLSAIGSVEPYLTDVVCCASIGYQFSTTSSTECDANYQWPEPPARKLGQWPEVTRQLSDLALKLQDALSVTMNRLVDQKLMNKGNLTVHIRSDEAPSPREETVEETLVRVMAMQDDEKASASARQLSGSLGGMATDLWNMIFGAPGTPIYNMIGNLGSWLDKAKYECDNEYCSWITETADWAGDQFWNIAATVLTVLNFAGAFFFGAGNLGFASYDVLLQFPKDRAVFNRENANGVHRCSSYFFAKLLADLPYQVIPGFVWSVIYYFMIGISTEQVWQPFAILGMSILITLTAYSFGYCISAWSPRMEVAVVVAPLILVVMLVLAGFFLRDDDFPVWIGWLKYFSIYRWGFFGVCSIQFYSGQSYGSLDNDLILPLLGVVETNPWTSVWALLVLSVGYRALAFIGLKYMHRRAGIEA